MIVLAGLACLHLAALNRKHQIMNLLVKKGADLNIQVSPTPPLRFIFITHLIKPNEIYPLQNRTLFLVWSSMKPTPA